MRELGRSVAVAALLAVVSAAVVIACRSAVPEAPISGARLRWCFRAGYAMPDGYHTAQGCFESRWQCENARGLARQHGSWAGLTGVGVCVAE